jgi:hypothetical protein
MAFVLIFLGLTLLVGLFYPEIMSLVRKMKRRQRVRTHVDEITDLVCSYLSMPVGWVSDGYRLRHPALKIEMWIANGPNFLGLIVDGIKIDTEDTHNHQIYLQWKELQKNIEANNHKKVTENLALNAISFYSDVKKKELEYARKESNAGRSGSKKNGRVQLESIP